MRQVIFPDYTERIWRYQDNSYAGPLESIDRGLYREDLAVSGQLASRIRIFRIRLIRLYREDLAVSGQHITINVAGGEGLYREDLAVSGQLKPGPMTPGKSNTDYTERIWRYQDNWRTRITYTSFYL